MSIESTIQENTETMRLLIAKFQSLTEALSNQPAAAAAPKAEKLKAPKADSKPAPAADEAATPPPAAPKPEAPKAPAASDQSAEIKAKASALLKAGKMPQVKAALSAAGVSTVTDACRLETPKAQAFLSALEALELE